MSDTETSATEKLLVSLTPSLKEAIVTKAFDMFGKRKGAISMYLEMVLRNHLDLKHENVEST